jgi:hypothetical protein
LRRRNDYAAVCKIYDAAQQQFEGGFVFEMIIKNNNEKSTAMGNSDSNRNLQHRLALVATGFGIGWLAGLSVSPVVSIVLTSLTASAATIIAALSGVKEELLDAKQSSTVLKQLAKAVTPVPLAVLTIGLLVGTSVGLWVRTHNWLSPDQPVPLPPVTLKEEIQQWVDLGMDEQEVVAKYFASRVNASSPAPTTVVPTPAVQASVLFATASQEECAGWQNLIAKERYDDLATEMATSAVKPFRQLPVIVTDRAQLAAIVEEVLCVASAP